MVNAVVSIGQSAVKVILQKFWARTRTIQPATRNRRPLAKLLQGRRQRLNRRLSHCKNMLGYLFHKGRVKRVSSFGNL